MRLKFYEIQKSVSKNDQKEQNISIHALTAGKTVKGEISKSDDIIYYTIRASLDENQKDALISLTKIKGDYIIYANRNG